MDSGLLTFRKQAGVTQAEMAKAMGLPLRTYEDIEAGRSVLRPVHIKAAQMAMIDLAVEKEDSLILYGALENRIRQAYALLPG